MDSLEILICCFLISIVTCTVTFLADSLPESDYSYANNFGHK